MLTSCALTLDREAWTEDVSGHFGAASQEDLFKEDLFKSDTHLIGRLPVHHDGNHLVSLPF